MQRTEITSKPRHEVEGKITCGLLISPPGGGKSTEFINEIVTRNARYLLAAPRIELIEEHVERLQAKMVATGCETLKIIVIHSEQPGHGGFVARRLRDALDDEDLEDAHVVVVATHAAVMDQEPGAVDRWHVRWDENPEAAVTSHEIGLGMSWRSLDAQFSLVPSTEAGWFRLTDRRGAERVGLGRILQDVSAEHLAEMCRLASSSGRVVEVDIAAWEDASLRAVNWRSIWSFAALHGCASLRVAAAGYEGSLADHAARRTGMVCVERTPVGSPRTGQPQITLSYFTEHPGSTTWWQTETGKTCLVAVSRYLERTEFDGYWSANEKIVPYFTGRLAGVEVKPKLAGSNRLREFTSCSLIYSSKAVPDDTAIIRALGLKSTDIQAAREGEDLFQFACRGRIRERDYAGPYRIYVYDLEQARALQARLIGAGYTEVITKPVPEAGILDVERPKRAKPGPKPAPIPLTAEERRQAKLAKDAQRKRETREVERATKIAAGTYKRRGRPKGS